MKVIIAGSRDIDNYDAVKSAIKLSEYDITEIVCGEARGVDSLGRKWAMENNIPIASFPITSQDWDTYGRSAGHIRNRTMGDYADALIAIWDGKSRGTKGMIDYMKTLHKQHVVFII
jgi:hypothetical protein